jgi:hypothetical protein
MDASQGRTEDTARGAFRCELCGATFPTAAALHGHVSRVHPEELDAPGPREPDVDRPSSPVDERLADESREPSLSEPLERDGPAGDVPNVRPPESTGGDGDEGEPETSDASSSRRRTSKKSGSSSRGGP